MRAPRPPEDGSVERPSTGSSILGSVSSSLAGPLAGLVTAPILARVLGPTGRGEVAAAVAFAMLGAAVAHSGGVQATMAFGTFGRHVTATRAALRQAVLPVIVVLGVGALLGIPPLDGELSGPALYVVIALPFIVAADLMRAGARGAGQHGNVNLETAGQHVVRLVLVVGLAIGGLLQVESATGAILAANVLGAIWFLPLITSNGVDQQRAFDKRDFRLYWWKATPGVVSHLATSRLDQVLIATLGTATELGYYAAVVPIGEGTRLLGRATHQVVLSDAIERRDLGIIWIAARLTLWGSSVVALVAFLFADWIVLLLLGPEFLPSAAVLRILLFAGVLISTASVLGSGLLATDEVGWWSGANMVGGVVTMGLLVALIPSLGSVGAAIASLIAYGIVFAITLTRIRWLRLASLPELLVLQMGDVRVGARSIRSVIRRDRQGSTTE